MPMNLPCAILAPSGARIFRPQRLIPLVNTPKGLSPGSLIGWKERSICSIPVIWNDASFGTGPRHG
jgi:hypothetical protein